MFVLRTAREIVAGRLGLELGQVSVETALGEGACDVLVELLARVEQTLADEQGLELPPAGEAGADLEGRLRRVALERSAEAERTVAGAAELATRAAVRLLVASRLDVPAAELAPELSFAVDLGADSLTRVDLVLLLEEALEVSVPDDSMSLVQTVGDSELFTVLYDRTREGMAQVFGEAGDRLAYNTPLRTLAPDAGRVALEAASRAAGMGLPETPPRSLQDAVRLAFVALRLREALAEEAGMDPAEVRGETRPVEELGLSPARTVEALRRLAGEMDLEVPVEVSPEQLATVSAVVAALAGPACGEGEGSPR